MERCICPPEGPHANARTPEAIELIENMTDELIAVIDHLKQTLIEQDICQAGVHDVTQAALIRSLSSVMITAMIEDETPAPFRLDLTGRIEVALNNLVQELVQYAQAGHLAAILKNPTPTEH